METLETFWQQMEQEPELLAVKQRLSALEAQIQTLVAEETWLLVLEWESLWAQYVTLCMERLYPFAYRSGWQASGKSEV